MKITHFSAPNRFVETYRLAEVNGANPRLQRNENFEIISLTGTLSQKGLHVHIGVADSTGKAFGGHLLDGNEVYYYVELIIANIKTAKYTRIWNGAPLDSEDEGSFHVEHQNTLNTEQSKEEEQNQAEDRDQPANKKIKK
jgi:hypothetical protein